MINSFPFSPRELDVIQLLLRGNSNKEIALALGITNRTVETHLSSIYNKMSVVSRTEAVVKLSGNADWEPSTKEQTYNSMKQPSSVEGSDARLPKNIIEESTSHYSLLLFKVKREQKVSNRYGGAEKPSGYAIIGIAFLVIIIIVSGFVFLNWPAGFIVVAAISTIAGLVSYLKSKRLEYKILALILFIFSCFWLLLLPYLFFVRS